jgi:ribosome biogenesis GTPase
LNTLSAFGWSHYLSALPDVEQELGDLSIHRHEPARVVRQERDLYRVVTQRGEREAVLAGRLRVRLAERGDAPVPGDWVLVGRVVGEGRVQIAARLERRTQLQRAAAGRRGEAQLVAANLDSVVLVTGLDGDVNPRRIERYLSAIGAGGARPVLALNKADLWPDLGTLDSVLDEVAACAPGVAIHVVSVLESTGLAELRADVLQPGHSVALVGSSGVGKSSLANAFLSDDVQAVGSVRATDKRGRHTTTRRDLILAPEGGVLIDTPGMRELGLWDAGEGLATAFPEVERLSEGCRYRDCQHLGEPGCAVIGALEHGDLEEDRLEGYQKLQREVTRRDRAAQRAETDRARRHNRRKRRRPRTARRDEYAEW